MNKTHRWIWFFLVLIGLGLVAMATLIVYNLGQQLKPEQLAAARRLWRERGWRSYQLAYTIKRGIDKNKDTYVVRVRAGKVVSSTVNGRSEERRLFSARGMEALFDDIERFQKLDSEPGKPRTFTRARFDENNGALREYVRRVMGGQERTEITVDPLEPLEDS
jgi:hypothetical protein